MSYLSKSASILAVAAVSLLTTASVQTPSGVMAQAATVQAGAGSDSGTFQLAEAGPMGGQDGPMSGPRDGRGGGWHDRPMPQCGPHGPGFRPMMGPMGPHAMMWRHHHHFDRAHLAVMLAAAEVEIGIRSNQLDAWRDFTDALLAMTEPPFSHDGGDWHDGGPDAGTADHDGNANQGSDQNDQAFSRVERFANAAIARGKSAEALLKSVDVLRSKLTPDQLNKVAMLEARFGHHHWGGPDGFHHDVGGPGGSQAGDSDHPRDDSPQAPR